MASGGDVLASPSLSAKSVTPKRVARRRTGTPDDSDRLPARVRTAGRIAQPLGLPQFDRTAGQATRRRRLTNSGTGRAICMLGGVSHAETTSRRPIAAASAAAALVLLMLASATSTSAQTGDWTSPHPMLLTPARAFAMLMASDRGLALRSRRGRGAVSRRRHTGRPAAGADVAAQPAGAERPALGRRCGRVDRSHRARRHGSRRAVAAPARNRIRGTQLPVSPERTPNDPGFAERQWNLHAIDMPRTWDINPGGNDTVIAAVVDTGITAVTRYVCVPDVERPRHSKHQRPVLDESRLKARADRQPARFRVLGRTGRRHGRARHARRRRPSARRRTTASRRRGIAYRVKLMPVKVCIGFWELQFVMSASGYRGFCRRESAAARPRRLPTGFATRPIAARR